MGGAEKGTGRGRGYYTQKGVQAQQSQDIAELKEIVAELVARLEETEPDEGEVTEEPTEG